MSTKILSKPAVRERIGVSDTTLWRLERRGEFPKAIKLSPGRVGWREADIEQWIEQRAAGTR